MHTRQVAARYAVGQKDKDVRSLDKQRWQFPCDPSRFLSNIIYLHYFVPVTYLNSSSLICSYFPSRLKTALDSRRLLNPFNLNLLLNSPGQHETDAGTIIMHSLVRKYSGYNLSSAPQCIQLSESHLQSQLQVLYYIVQYYSISPHVGRPSIKRHRGVQVHSTFPYSVFVFCSGSIEVTTFDLSGSNAATSSIFLNCHGNRDGYRNGRRSKPAKKIKFIFKPDVNDAKAPKQ